MEELEVREWLIAAQKEDWNAYESLRPRIFGWVFRIAFKILQDEGKAEEAAAVTLFKLYIKRAAYDPSKNAKAYVSTVAVRVALDMITGRREEPLDLDDVWMQKILSRASTQLDDVTMKEAMEALRVCLSKLSDLQRRAVISLVLRRPDPELEGHRMHNATNRARNNLRECMRKAGHELLEYGKRK
jgi:DNA-directed RNA polymerase specialized sigma24 family protein